MSVAISVIFALCSSSPGIASDASARWQTHGTQTGGEKIYAEVRDSVFRVETDKGVGTGFLAINASSVVTCAHVIKEASTIKVLANKGGEWSVTAVLVDEKRDVAILTINRPSSRRQLRITETQPAVGSKVFTVGNPLGFLTNTLSEGIIGGLRNSEGCGLLQISAPISPGSSGSPVLNERGDVIGVVSSTFSAGQSLNIAVDAVTIGAACATSPIKTWDTFVSEGKAMRVATPPPASPIGLSVLLNHLARCQVSAVLAEFATGQERTRAIDDFDRFWFSFADGREGSELISDPRFANLREQVEVYRSKLRKYAADEAESDARTSPLRTEQLIVSLQERSARQDAAATALSGLGMLSWGRHFVGPVGSWSIEVADKDQVSAQLSPAAFWVFSGAPQFRTNTQSTGDKLIPDFDRPNECAIGQDVLGPDEYSAVHQEVFEANANGPFRTLREAVKEKSTIREGQIVFQIKAFDRGWVQVPDWRALTKLAEEMAGSPSGTASHLGWKETLMRVGPTLESVQERPVWVLAWID